MDEYSGISPWILLYVHYLSRAEDLENFLIDVVVV
jgi:hypothetical protein